MEGPYWLLVVSHESTKKDQIIHQTWSKDCEERANTESNSQYANYTDHTDWSEHWSARSGSIWTLSPANKFVYSNIT